MRLRTTQITKRYGRSTVLDGVDLSMCAVEVAHTLGLAVAAVLPRELAGMLMLLTMVAMQMMVNYPPMNKWAGLQVSALAGCEVRPRAGG